MIRMPEQDDGEIEHPSTPSHFVVAEINGVRITTKPHTFRPDAENDLMDIEEFECVDKARVVSYE